MPKWNCYYSEDRESIIVVYNNREDVELYSIEDFISAYGEDALPPEPVEAPRQEAAEQAYPVLEYLGEFKACIDACGQVSYYWNMKNFVVADVNKAKIVASAYQHDLRYYEDQLREWLEKARRSYSVLKLHAEKFGYNMPKAKEFLNGLTLSKDRRKAFKGYLETYLKKREAPSPAELEEKFQLLLEKRLKRKKA